MKEIPLTKGAVALLDDDDYERLKDYSYSLNNRGYGRRYSKEIYQHCKKVTCTLMHHDVIGKPPIGKFVDHINRNKLDNRKENLRFVTRRQNNVNRSKSKHKETTSKYLGVSYDPTRKKWKAQICFYYKRFFIGRYKTEREAALAYNHAAIKYHGEYANLNVITEEK